MPNNPASWTWEQTDPSRSSSSGDIAKLFRHEETKNPGVFAVNAPPANAALMAREVIQNSWDAARELQDSEVDAPDFEIEFRFENLNGGEKLALVNALDLGSLATRLEAVDRRSVGVTESTVLDSILNPVPLPILVIEERGTTGMYGSWENARSRMYLALVSLGYTEKSSARAGGSYGFGKAGVIRGSAIRTVIAYSCFREREDDPGVTRRLLGMTYWGQHDIDGTNYTGFARYGKLACDGTVKPFENSDADAIADSLGLRQRDPRQPEDLGSTFLVLEPTVRPTDLLRAVERSWWPALADRLFEVTVRTPDGVKSPRPLKDEVLRTFVRAYEVATVPRDNPKPDERKLTLGPIEMKGRRVDHPGDLALIVDLQGWSYADQIGTPDDEGSRVDHRSLIALMRGPRMVVEYLDVGQSYPYVRGVFIASEEIDEELRRTEPKSHDAWLTESDEGALDVESATIARAVIKRIKANAAQFRSLHRPPVPPPEDVHLPLFNSVMRSVMSGAGAGWKPPIHDTRPVVIRISHEPEALGLGQVRLRGSATISLSEHFEGDTGTIEVSLYYRFIEDERVGAYANLIVEHRGPFRKVEGAAGRFIGSLTRAEEARFDFVSEPYSAEWSGRLIVNGHPLRQRNGGGV